MYEDSNLYKRMCEWQKPGLLGDAKGEAADLGVICNCELCVLSCDKSTKRILLLFCGMLLVFIIRRLLPVGLGIFSLFRLFPGIALQCPKSALRI